MDNRHLIKLPDSFSATTIDDELVMIHRDTGKFFALKDIGLRIWHILEDEPDIDRLCDALLSEFEVDAEECRKSVLTFADQLVGAGLARYA